MERIIDRFDKYMEFRKLNDNKVTVHLNISVGRLGKSRIENRDLSPRMIKLILNFYVDIEERWLLAGVGEMIKREYRYKRVPEFLKKGYIKDNSNNIEVQNENTEVQNKDIEVSSIEVQNENIEVPEKHFETNDDSFYKDLIKSQQDIIASQQKTISELTKMISSQKTEVHAQEDTNAECVAAAG